ncbi:MAG: 1-(5-phosphoribosyl)-5-[(5-phosphoribosylamino)methylideneamino]imidazole-4-carboxamide isomerase [Clostridia bacterium]|nr:1-(5-phosphoribosyl)-5-[(5-phosphoribosylamino)methylideneamino]imidazole-4-carboxamide isomerase [Clostridia bacterium]MCI8980022.1 1-(5-phosphoribosyl)-5-[(5-phosphoribosylamino)methylideneamino]imidazole-4-carboxamide isomerase [Clostridia bacterium]MCI9086115.1 1-(5-phosphoribosyl)-5-[(5-phosphoribosylamino)methylideneamino]imidazole-4-carboxamide isomerase [Clostridia bacterium]
MMIYPAIDIKDGQCVRLFKGQFSDVTVYGDSPAEIAKKWESLGGEYIHVVDLDGALKGHGVNAEKIKEICNSVNVPVQTGGGIRTMEDIEAKLECGIDRVIIGTKAVADSDFVKRAVDKYGQKIVIGIDAKDGMVAIEGWEKTSDFTAVEFAKKMVSIGVQTIVYTDIATDGTLAGPNVDAMAEMTKAVDADIIASGGIGSLEHIKSLVPTGVEGVIVGKALYTGKVNLTEAVREVKI